MSVGGWRRGSRAARGAACAALLLHGEALQARRAEESRDAARESRARIRVHDIGTTWPLARAVDGAHRLLEHSACQEVFSDFSDPSGRPLSDVLAERGITGQDQLGRLTFVNGSGERQCRVPGVSAVTAPGHHVIYICPVQFRRAARDPAEARALVIHEMLHSLGLGENPPTSREITARVRKRCRA